MPETPTRFSKHKERLLNKKWVALATVVGVIIIGLASFSEAVRKLMEPFIEKPQRNEVADDSVVATEIISNCYRRALHFGYGDRWASEREMKRIMDSVAEANGFLQAKLVTVTNRHPAILPHLQALQESCSKIDESFQKVSDWLEANKENKSHLNPDTGAPAYYDHVIAAERHRLQFVKDLVALAESFDVALPQLSEASILAQPRSKDRLRAAINRTTPPKPVSPTNP